MKRGIVALLLISALLPLLSSCELFDMLGGGPAPTEHTARMGEIFTLKIGEKIKVIEPNAIVTFIDLVEDSRCPVDVTCIWPGNAKVLIEVQIVDRTPQRIELNSALDPREVSFADYQVHFMGIQPPKRSTQDTPKKDYVLSLKVDVMKTP